VRGPAAQSAAAAGTSVGGVGQWLCGGNAFPPRGLVSRPAAGG